MVDVKGALSKNGGRKLGRSAEEVDETSSILENKMEGARRGREWVWLVIDVIITIVVVLVVFKFIFGVSTVQGESMLPNYKNGDKVVYLRLAKTYSRGDVVIFQNKKGEDLIKRIIATAGDTVDIDDQTGTLIINGRSVKENYIYVPTTKIDETVPFPQTVAKGKIFVLGDNRVDSTDSRSSDVGQVPIKDVAGRVMMQGRTIK